MQTAEQAVNEQASYMGKDYLQRSISKVLTRNAQVRPINTTLGPQMCVCLFRSLGLRRDSLALVKQSRR